MYPDVSPNTQQARGIEVDLRARYLGFHDRSSTWTHLDPTEQGNDLEALRAPLAHRNPKPQPLLRIAPYLARPVPERYVLWSRRCVRSLRPLSREDTVRPQGDVHLPPVVVAGTVPEALRSVHSEREDHPLGDSRADGIVGHL